MSSSSSVLYSNGFTSQVVQHTQPKYTSNAGKLCFKFNQQTSRTCLGN